jgi:hypothetical protein
VAADLPKRKAWRMGQAAEGVEVGMEEVKRGVVEAAMEVGMVAWAGEETAGEETVGEETVGEETAGGMTGRWARKTEEDVKQSMDPSLTLVANEDLKRWLLMADEMVARAVAVALSMAELESLLMHYTAAEK